MHKPLARERGGEREGEAEAPSDATMIRLKAKKLHPGRSAQPARTPGNPKRLERSALLVVKKGSEDTLSKVGVRRLCEHALVLRRCGVEHGTDS